MSRIVNGIVLIFALSALTCFLPMLLDLPIPMTSPSDEIYVAFESTWLKIVLFSSLVLTIPVLLEILRDLTLFRSTLLTFDTTLSNLFLIVSIIFPNLLILIIVIPSQNLRLFICLSQLRMNAFVTSFALYILLIGGKYWQSKRDVAGYVIGIVGNCLMAWSEFFPEHYYTAILTLSIILIAISVMVFSFDIIKWLLALYQTLEAGQSLTVNEFGCNVYVLSAMGFYGAYSLTYFAFGLPRCSQYNTSYMVLCNFYFGAWFIAVSVFQGGVARRQVILEVRVFDVRIN